VIVSIWVTRLHHRHHRRKEEAAKRNGGEKGTGSARSISSSFKTNKCAVCTKNHFHFFFSNKKILNCITKLQTKVFVTQSFDGFISSPLLIVIIIIINIHDYRSRQPDIFVYTSLEAIRNGGFPIQFRFMNYFFSWVRKIISKNRI
jgi:hypothetical protein